MAKLLIIEEDAATREMLRSSLGADDCCLAALESGEQGLRAFVEYRPEVVIVGKCLPGPDGTEILRRLKQVDPNVEVIVAAATEDPRATLEALQLGASDVVFKPINQVGLSVALWRAKERITMRRQLRECYHEVQKRSDFEHNLIVTSIDGIIANDRSGKIIIFNDGASRIYGYTRDEALQHLHVTDLYGEGEARKIKKLIYGPDYGGLGRLINYEIQALTKDRRLVPILLSATLIYQEGKEVATVGYFKDLTEIKRLQLELLQSARMAAMGYAMAEVAHGVKNILYGMQLGAYLLEKGLQEDTLGEVKKGWHLVAKNIERVSRLTLDMLSYARNEMPRSDMVSLNSLANDICEAMIDPAKNSGILLERQLAPDLPMTLANAQGLHTCMLNLVTNALEAFPEDHAGARVVVRTQLTPKGRLVFEVTDNGRGMSQELQEAIFKPLFTTKGARGTGLGLAITQKIIQEHGGSIQVESESNRGSTFTMGLPVVS
jgi:PAS domain S-box-containing protein